MYYRLLYLWLHLDNTSLFISYPVEGCKITVILFGSVLPNLKGHLRGSSSRNRGMAHPFLILFTALKGSVLI